MALRDRPDDVLRAERGVAAEEDARQARLQGDRVQHRHAPLVEVDAGIALDPRERVLLADRDQHVVAFEDLLRLAGRDELAAALSRRAPRAPCRSSCRSACRSVCRNAFGTRQSRIGMPSWIASSFSHGDAFISSNGERTITLTSLPPSRFELRQQSIAVLPPPSTMTRWPICVVWPNDTDDSQSMPMWMLAFASLRPGIDRSRPRGAPEPTKTASHFSPSSCFIESTRWLAAEFDAELHHVAGLFVDHLLGQPKRGICDHIMPPAFLSPSKTTTS
jgi:hypothetical protein